MWKKGCILILLLMRAYLYSDGDLIVFSYNRPMQLYAFLESVTKNVEGVEETIVIYRTSDPIYEEGYGKVKKAFPDVIFMQEGQEKKKGEFKELVLASLFHNQASYLLFAVDDLVVTRPVILKEAIQILEKEGAYAYFFRLGLNIDVCYMQSRFSGTPAGDIKEDQFFVWQFLQGKGDWIYPNNVDFTLYRKKDVIPLLQALAYNSPNELEAIWAQYAPLWKRGVAPLHSSVVNIPLNVVSSFGNIHMGYRDSYALAKQFLAGDRIDIEPLQFLDNNSPHFAIEPSFRTSNLENGVRKDQDYTKSRK